MKKNSIKTNDATSLKEELLSLLREQFNLRMQKGSGGAIKPHLFSQVRRQIARVKTQLHELSRAN
jgi:large subunit ribosomal protein L29